MSISMSTNAPLRHCHLHTASAKAGALGSTSSQRAQSATSTPGESDHSQVTATKLVHAPQNDAQCELMTDDCAIIECDLFTPMAGASYGLRRDDPRILRDILDAANYFDAFCSPPGQ